MNLISPWQSYDGAGAANWGLGNTHGNFEYIFAPVSVTPSAQPNNSKSNGDKDLVGEPIEVSSGIKISSHTDFALPGEMGLKFVRYYRSGTGWTDSTDYSLDVDCGGADRCVHVTLSRPDGSSVKFRGAPATVGDYPEAGGGGLATLTGNSDGSYVLHDEDATTQIYNAAGQLLSIKDASGIGWTLTHSYNPQTTTWTTRVTHTNGQFMTVVKSYVYSNNVMVSINKTVTDPAGHVYTDVTDEHYPSSGETVTFPGSPTTAITYNTSSDGSGEEIYFNGVPYLYTTFTDCAVGNGAYVHLANGTHMADGSQATSIAYTNGCGMTATITNPLHHAATNQYLWAQDAIGDGYNQLASTSEPAVIDGPATTQTRSYDANGNLVKTVDNDGVSHTYTYAANGQLQTETEAAGTSVARTTVYVWDSNQQLNRLTSVTIEGESKTSYTYNPQNRIASVTRTDLTAVGGVNSLTTAYTYALYGNGMVQSMTVTPPNSAAKVTTHYDTLGNVTSVVDGLGHTTTYTGYNGLGEPGHVTGPNGDVTDYTYDARGRVATKITHPNGTTATWSYAYDGFGLLASVTAPGNDVTTWTRNPYLQVTSISHNDKDGTSTESFGYDANGDVTSDVIARGSDVGKTTTTVYDALGRVYQRKGANGQVLTYAYDGNGNVLSVTDALGHKTSYQYDALNRVTRMMEANGGSTYYTYYAYDAGDHLAKVTDPRGLITTYSHDGLGLLWSQTSPDTGTTTFNYDSYGRLTNKHLSGGTNQNFTYDALNRLTNATADAFSQTWTYDTCTNGRGRLCSVADGHTTTSYSYSPQGWIQGRGFTVDGTTYSLGYGYDSMGRLASVNYPDGNQALYYYTDGAVSKVDLQVGRYLVIGVSGITYRPMDAATSSWKSYNGLMNTIGYDSDLRPTSISVPGVQSLSFAYDAADRITKITNGMDGTMTQTLGYDPLSRLTSVSSGAENESYMYDADGNRLSQNVNGVSTTYQIEATNNRLLSRSSGGTTINYKYDPEGDVFGYGPGTPSQMFYYTAFDRLNSTLVNGVATHFDVNPEGQRLRKYTSTGSTYFAPDVSGNLLAEDINGTWYDYVWLNGRMVEVIANGGVFSLHDDQTGRPQVMTEPNGTSIDWAAQNKPFDRTVTTNALGGSFNIGFPGQYYDSEDSLWYNGARDYDATLGRYIESDPMGLRGGINTYIYAGANPISNIDSAGMEAMGSWTFAPGSPDAQAYSSARNGCGDNAGLKLTAMIIATEIVGGGPEDPIADAIVADELAEDGLITVTHFTSAEGAAAIGEGGTLNAGSFVTTSDLSGMSATDVESTLEISSGKGAFSTTFQTPASNLGRAFNGPLTSGGAPQFQLMNPTQVTTFVPTGG